VLRQAAQVGETPDLVQVLALQQVCPGLVEHWQV